MNRKYRVITFGLTDEENVLVEENLLTRDYEVFDADAPTDLIAIGCQALIINAVSMDSDSVGIILTTIYRSLVVPMKL